jgi:serine/threonine-protein kinase
LPPTPSPPSSAKVNAVWAGEVDGGGASIAISVKDGVAVAYLCDGKKAEIWLQGTAENGKLSLASKKGEVLTGTFGAGKATGKITGAGKTFSFSVGIAQPPSGLYRSTENVRNAQVVCGWIRLANGSTVGICSSGGSTEAAPPLDTSRVNPINPESADLS